MKMRVLVIDDNDDHRNSLATSLHAAGWEVAMARTGKAGIDLAATLQPHVVISELSLPDVLCMTLPRTIRSMVEHDIKVIALTQASQELFEGALSAGYDHVEAKPSTIDTLLSRMSPPPL